MSTFINISDIHFSSSISDTQSLMLNIFFDDLSSQCRGLSPSELYLIISGDLVQAGNSDNFNAFKNIFLKNIQDKTGISYDNMIFVPGNHDLNRDFINKRFLEFQGFLTPPNEEAFKNYLSIQDFEESILSKKFDEFTAFYQSLRPGFCKKDKTDITGYHISLNEKIHILCLNSALCSFGGLNHIDDRGQGLLNVDTEKVAKWLNTVRGKSGLKMIIMHHPHEYLSVWAKDKLRTLLKNEEKLCILYGHTHNQDIGKYIDQSNDILYCTAPQMFSGNEKDLLGYSIMSIDDSMGKIQHIKYREWNNKQQCYNEGLSFAKDGGIISFAEKQEIKNDHLISSLSIEEYNKLTEQLLTDKSLLNDDYVSVIRTLERLKEYAICHAESNTEFFNFLCKYIRTRTENEEIYLKELEWISLPYDYKKKRVLPYDIQLAFILLFKDCSKLFDSIQKRVNLSNLVLFCTDFLGMKVKNVDFSHSMLQHSKMYKKDKLQQKSIFDNCLFDNAFLDASNMFEATFNNCSFINTNLRWANMYGVKLNNCNFIGCQMTGVILSEAHISNCKIENCKIDASELMNIHFETPIIMKNCSFCYAYIYSNSIIEKINVTFEFCN